MHTMLRLLSDSNDLGIEKVDSCKYVTDEGYTSGIYLGNAFSQPPKTV